MAAWLRRFLRGDADPGRPPAAPRSDETPDARRPLEVVDVGRSRDLIAGSPYGKHTDGCTGWFWNGEG